MGNKSKVVILLLLTVIVIYTVAFVLLIKPLLDDAASKINLPSQNVVPVVVSKAPEPIVENEKAPEVNLAEVVDSVLSSKDLTSGVGKEIADAIQNQMPSMVDESIKIAVDKKLATMVDESVAVALDKKLPTVVDESVSNAVDKNLPTLVDDSVNKAVAKTLPTLVDESVNNNVEKKVPLIITNVSSGVLDNLEETIPEEIAKALDAYVDILLKDERFTSMVEEEVNKYGTNLISKSVAEESGTSVEYVETLIQESMKDEFTSQKNEIVDRVVDQIKKEDLGKVETPKEVEAVQNSNEVVSMENGETFELETKPYMEDLNYLSAEEYERMRQELLNSTVNDILNNLKD